jgi:hypothetical protein
MIILVKLLVGDLVFNVISVYAPQIGLNESVKMQFWEKLDAMIPSLDYHILPPLNKNIMSLSSIRLGGLEILEISVLI